MKDIPHENFAVMENRPDSLGSMLAEARSARNLSRREAARRLGVSPSIVQALEEDAFQQLGAPVFVRGYLIRYARLLGLPEQEILDRYKRLGIGDPPLVRVSGSIKPQAKMNDTGVRWISYLLVFGMMAYLGWLGLEQVSSHLESSAISQQSGQDDEGKALLALPPLEPVVPERDKPPLAVPSASVPGEASRPEAPVTASENQGAAGPELIAAPGDEAVPSPAIAEEVQNTPSTFQDVQTPQFPSEETAEPREAAVSDASVAGGGSRLVMKFTDDCWVDIKDANGERLAYGLMKANTTQALSGAAPFSMVLGNAGAVNIEINGQSIDKAIYVPKRGTVARFTLDLPG